MYVMNTLLSATVDVLEERRGPMSTEPRIDRRRISASAVASPGVSGVVNVDLAPNRLTDLPLLHVNLMTTSLTLRRRSAMYDRRRPVTIFFNRLALNNNNNNNNDHDHDDDDDCLFFVIINGVL